MKTKEELKGNYIFDFINDNQEKLAKSILENGLCCCDHCGYITDELVRFKDYDFTQSNVLKKDYEVLCDDCYEYFYSQDFIKQTIDN